MMDQKDGSSDWLNKNLKTFFKIKDIELIFYKKILAKVML